MSVGNDIAIQFEPKVRYATGPDWEAIVDIDNESSLRPWTVSDLRRHIGQQDCTAMVATVGPPSGMPEIVAGFLVYKLSKFGTYEIVKFAVAERYRRLGLGTKLLNDMKQKAGMSYTRRSFMFAVPERNFDAHAFLRARDVRATRVLRRHFGINNDAYLFVYNADAPPKGNPLPGA